MKFSALALDYDGTIAVGGVFDPAVRNSVGEARRRGIVVILVTGRRLPDLHTTAGDLTCFDVIVAENGTALEFPASGRHVVIGHVPSPAFLQELQRRSIPFVVGESVVEADAQWADPILDVIRSLEQGHLRRHDFSRWIEDVFRDRSLAAHLHKVEASVETDDPRDVADTVAQAIRARYETAPDK